MASLSITLQARSLSSSPLLQSRPRLNPNPNPLFHSKPYSISDRNPSLSKTILPQTKRIFAICGDGRRDPWEENQRRIPFSDVAVDGKKRAFWKRRWNYWDATRASEIAWVHVLSLLAPFHFNLAALRLAVVIHLIAGFGITLSYHRNLAHRSFNLPKWLEYSFALCGTLAGQGDPIEWVSYHRYHHQYCDTARDPHSPKDGFWFSHIFWIFDTDYIAEKCGGRSNVEDLVKQPFYRILQRTWIWSNVALALLLYMWGGLPFFIWGCVRKVFTFHGTFLVNSASHVWGNQVWKTNDLSRNNWWVAVIALGEGWHNNHHAFEFSARQGLEWWQLDVTWYIIRFLQVIGLATDVKLPTEAQKRRMALD
ncbi:PREDICTED: delta-9 acyl-lipid desaturase 1-like isoform X2 [Tarenaya hassleriana]|uniref:delta-9 acyl-lipid desaturase 1-like isoform X2 n=1 Tax=Tarenaya hassleriana TaxID=28532 RepID=UPI00053C81B1|nr:PREDICTED: delta-9 acyl-lipid desaturase 1-like isoform X2 [Tarenaya hassleriana]